MNMFFWIMNVKKLILVIVLFLKLLILVKNVKRIIILPMKDVLMLILFQIVKNMSVKKNVVNVK